MENLRREERQKRTQGRGVPAFNRVVKKILCEKVTDKQKMEGSEGMNHVDR